MSHTNRTRRNPGPTLLAVAACLAMMGVVVSAHDPGLSALDARVETGRISAVLSMAAPDVALAAPAAGDDTPRQMAGLAVDSIRLSVGGQPLASTVDRVWMEEGAAYVQLLFPAPDSPGGLVTIVSDVPARLARGHRQLLTVRLGERIIAQHLLDAASAPVSIARGFEDASAWPTASSLFGLGVRHILGGYDHLVFLAGLLLASRRVRELMTALTAFTVAHSITLALAGAGAIHVPPAVVEPLIAASIAWVGLETLMQRRRPGVRWMVVFAFGLVHGFGFAEALTDLGRWSSAADIAVTLVSFNAGVEAGQVAVAAAFLPFVWFVRGRPAWNARLVPVCSVLIACAGGYWLLDRL